MPRIKPFTNPLEIVYNEKKTAAWGSGGCKPESIFQAYDRAGDDLQKRIQDLINARFQYEKPEVKFSTERLEFEAPRDEVYQGSFRISSETAPMHGFVYASNSRVKCLKPEFEGTEAEIPFEFHSGGLKEGDIQKGNFTVVVNGGEYSLSFVASVTRFYVTASIGKIKNLFDFANLAQVSYEEAYRIFTAPVFESILKDTEEKERLLYRGLGGRRASRQGMEEFLIGVRKKQRMIIRLEEQEKRIYNVAEEVREMIRIKKSQWGYLSLAVSSDSEAVTPVKERITSRDFRENYAELGFVIHPEKLHAGNNYARLKVRGLHQEECCALRIHKARPRPNRFRMEKKNLQKRLVRLYLDYRLGRIVTGVWAKDTCECLERLRELEPENQWYELYQAQALLINKQRQEAEWLLEGVKRELPPKDSPLYAYYLYVCTLQDPEEAYVGKVFRQVEKIYRRNQENLWLFLIMLFLDPDWNQSRSRKLAAIEEKASGGMASPLLYLEAYYLLRGDVYLLHKPGDFERKVLHWAVREEALTPEVAQQAVQLILKVRKYHPAWYGILEACCRKREDAESLQAMCSFCIKWNRRGERAFVWYEKGIQAELKLAGLYEAWLECAGPGRMEALPRTVALYFQYQNRLSDRKRAQLYAGIWQNREKQKSLYSAYQQQIREFSLAKLREGQLDENLAVLYEEEIRNLDMNPELSEALTRILYAHKFTCRDERAARVIVLHKELKEEQSVPLIQHQAYIRIYTGSYCILAEDENGVRYLPRDSFEVTEMMKPGSCVRQCMKAAPDALPHLLHYFDGKKTFQTFQEEDMPGLLKLLESEEVSQDYRMEMKPQVIEYYYNAYQGETLDLYLKELDYEGLKQEAQKKLTELMIARGIYDRAYGMLLSYGSDQVSVSRLMILVSQKMEEVNFEKDERLLGFCQDILRRGKYNESVLMYLGRYGQGSVKELEKLWMACREFGIRAHELEERFLVQLLYTESYTECMEQIFQSYYENQGQEQVIFAYLSYFSYQYFVKEVLVSDPFFECLTQQFLSKRPMNDSCKLAYFKWLAQHREPDWQQQAQMDELLEEYARQNKYFAFYEKLPLEILRKHHLHDRIILEYRTNPSHRVLIDYCLTGAEESMEFMEEEMEQMFEGIFAKWFVVFYGEEIPYYIKEESPNRQMITESGHIKCEERLDQGDESGYDLLNGMMISYQHQDYKTLRQLYGQFLKQQQRTEEEFLLL